MSDPRGCPTPHLQTPPLGVLIRRLRKHAPLSAPVRVRYRAGVRCRGQLVLGVAGCRTHKGRVLRFQIVIDSRLPLGEQWEILIHEWAHCLDRDAGRLHHPKDCHDSRWGQHYARAFRASQP